MKALFAESQLPGPHRRDGVFSRYALAKFDRSGNARLEPEQVIEEVLLLKVRASQRGICKFLVIIILSLTPKLIGNLDGDSSAVQLELVVLQDLRQGPTSACHLRTSVVNAQDSKQAAGARSNSLEEMEGLEETWAGGPLQW